MGMPAPTTWTAEMVRALPDDGNRYEVIDGTLLVTPAPSYPHQRAVRELLKVLDPYLTEHGIGEVMLSPADIELDPKGLVQPDVFVQGLVDGHLSRAWNSGAPLMLVAEILSPSTARYDRITKRLRFQRAGIPEYWIVDIDGRIVERWRPGDERPEMLAESLSWQPEPAAEPLVIDLVTMFARIHGEPTDLQR